MAEHTVTYRGWLIEYSPPPIPVRMFDWQYAHKDYDGTPNNPGEGPADHRCGATASLEAAKAEIDEYEAEHAED